MSKVFTGVRTPQPPMASTGLACATISGSNVVTSAAAFGSVVAGQPVKGTGVRNGSVVGVVNSTSSITLVDSVTGKAMPCTATGSPTLAFGYGTPAAYAAGDVVGFQFPILTPAGADGVYEGGKKIIFIQGISETAISYAMTLWIFRDQNFTEAADSAAFAPTAEDLRTRLLCVVPLVNTTAFVALLTHGAGNPAVLTMVNPPQIPLDQGANFGLLVAQAAFTPAAVDDFSLKLHFEENQ